MSIDGEPAPQSAAVRKGSGYASGRLLAGRYRLQGVLGEGGMAVVYEGEHVALGKRVAVKIVQSLFANDDEIVHRFQREARSASAVESEHIVHVFDVGADPELGLFLVMELLKGEDLASVLTRRRRLDPLFACGLVKQAALGLEKAHAAGVVHRDLKPANVFLVEHDDGTTLVKLVDFGIAKIVHDAEEARIAGRKGITRQGTAIGTPQYMSPEQAQALDTVDHRTDVFSLGALLFEAIAGTSYMPERPTYEQTILQLVSTPAPRLSSVVPDIPPALDDLVADMLEHDVTRRVQDMRTVRERIELAYPELTGSSVKLRSLPPPSSPGPLEMYDLSDRAALDRQAAAGQTVSGTSATALRRPMSRRPLLLVAVAAIVTGGMTGAAVMWRWHTVSQAVPPSAELPTKAGSDGNHGGDGFAAMALGTPPSALPSPAAAAPSLTAPQSPSTAVESAPAVASVAPTTSSSLGSSRTRSSASPPVAGQGGQNGPAHERGPVGSKGHAEHVPQVDQVGAAGISSQF